MNALRKWTAEARRLVCHWVESAKGERSNPVLFATWSFASARGSREDQPSAGRASAHPRKPPSLADDIMVKLVQAETLRTAEELQAAYEKLFWLCYRNGLDPSRVLAEACPQAEVPVGNEG